MQLSGDTTAGAILYSLLLLVFTAGLIAIGWFVVWRIMLASNKELNYVLAGTPLPEDSRKASAHKAR